MAFTPEIAASEVETAYRRYITRFAAHMCTHLGAGGSLDLGTVGFWAFPLLNLTTTPLRIETARDFNELVGSVYVGYRAEGWAGRAEIDEVTVAMVSPTLAAMHARGTRYRGDGSALNHWDTMYLLRRGAEDWEAFAFAGAGPDDPGLASWRAWLAQAVPFVAA